MEENHGKAKKQRAVCALSLQKETIDREEMRMQMD